eukprot:1152020-Pelagomonas_calceolata.AAC.1
MLAVSAAYQQHINTAQRIGVSAVSAAYQQHTCNNVSSILAASACSMQQFQHSISSVSSLNAACSSVSKAPASHTCSDRSQEETTESRVRQGLAALCERGAFVLHPCP